MRDGLNLIVAEGASARGPLRCARIHKPCIKYVWSPVIGLHLTFAFCFCALCFSPRDRAPRRLYSLQIMCFLSVFVFLFLWSHATHVQTGLWCACQSMTALFVLAVNGNTGWIWAHNLCKGKSCRGREGGRPKRLMVSVHCVVTAISNIVSIHATGQVTLTV